MSELSRAVEEIEPPPPASRVTAIATDILQGLLLACVVGWVLDLPRQFLGLSLYTEQLLTVCLGIGLAICFIGSEGRPERRFDIGGAVASLAFIVFILLRFSSPTEIPLGVYAGLLFTLLWTAFGSRLWAIPWFDWVGGIVALAICLYIAVRYEPLTYELAMLPTEGIVGSAILLVLVLEATRRTSGAILVVIILALVAYVFIGPHLPADFQTRPVSPERLIVYLGLDTNGMIGAVLAVAVLIVVPFTLMGQVLGRTGGASYFADLAMSGMGRFRGGAAKISVAGSSLFGLVSGAAVSNVVAVGTVTIPLMKRSGFTGKRAAAIEAVGSTGGQLMPPVMGAAAFIMAEFLQVPYGSVVIAAIIPSLLFYAALFINVDLVAAKEKIGAAQAIDAPRFMEVLKSGWHFPIPIIFLIATLIYPEVFQIPIERAAIYTTAMLIVLSMMFGYRGRRVSLYEVFRAIIDSGRAALDIVLISAAAGLVVGTLTISGIAFGLTMQLITIAGESLVVLLIMAGAISIILGMGMPTVSVYVLTASLLAPSLIQLGVTPMAAHMYVMYFGMLSMITPPVAIATFAAASIARVPGMATSLVSVMVGWSTFVIPFLFVTTPALLMDGSTAEIIWHLARNLFGLFIGTAAIIGFAFTLLSKLERLVFGIVALMILLPPNAFPGADVIDWIGLAAGVCVLAYDRQRSKVSKKPAVEETTAG